MDLTIISIFILGLAISGALGFFIGKSKVKGSDDQSEKLKLALEIEQRQSSQRDQEFGEINKQLREEREKYLLLNSEKSRLEADFRNLQERMQEQKTELNELQQKFTTEFKNLANEILEDKSKKFTDQNSKNIGELLNPLKEKIESFEKKVEQTNKDAIEQNTALKTQLEHIKELNQRITKEAESLTKALKMDTKKQGNWGEMQLEAILNSVGLEKDLHYFKEKNMVNDEGSNQRPDYIIKLPDDKYIVLDSKVSLTAYANFFETEDEEAQQIFLKRHLESINGHIKTLGEKKYQSLYGIQQPDFILMFVANEPALSVAWKEDQSLYQKAMDQRVVMVSTSTLLATLSTISYIWKQDLTNKNAQEIARQAGALYDKFVNFSEDLMKIGTSIESTHKVYKEAAKKLYDGQDNLVRKTERLKELGAKTSKQIKPQLLDKAQ